LTDFSLAFTRVVPLDDLGFLRLLFLDFDLFFLLLVLDHLVVRIYLSSSSSLSFVLLVVVFDEFVFFRVLNLSRGRSGEFRVELLGLFDPLRLSLFPFFDKRLYSRRRYSQLAREGRREEEERERTAFSSSVKAFHIPPIFFVNSCTVNSGNSDFVAW
jgi:hypothetical protein